MSQKIDEDLNKEDQIKVAKDESTGVELGNVYMNNQSLNVRNIDEIYFRTLELSEAVYEPDVKFDVDKYFIQGTFPCLITYDGDLLYIAFRGTNRNFSNLETAYNSVANIWADFDTWDGTNNQELSSHTAFINSLDGEKIKLKVHAGFAKELNKYYQDIRDEIDKYKGSVNSLIITGHSAGGALATLFYYVYENDINRTKLKIPVEKCITYGSPRVLINSHLNMELFYNKCTSLIRIFNTLDIVPYLPLHNPVTFTTNIASGFTHVGLPFPLDSNVKNNSLNLLILNILKSESDSMTVMNNFSMEEVMDNDLISFMFNDKYLKLLSESMFTAYQNFTTKPNQKIKQEGYIDELITKLREETDYNKKCDLLKDFSISDILKENPIGETDAQQNFTISGIINSILGYNEIGVKAHLFPEYIKNLTLLLNREVDKGIPISDPVEDGKYNVLPYPVVPSLRKMLNELENILMEEIQSGKIVGLLENYEEGDIMIEFK